VLDLTALTCPHPLRRHQQEALDAVAKARADGATRWWVTMPPGAGKTLVGTETARLLGRPTVVFSPNTAIQGQWARTWDAYDGERAGSSRDLSATFTSLTYQSLAVFDRDLDDEEVDGPIGRLHANGQALIARMEQAGPITVVLDECHHLLEVWGQLLRDVLARLPEAVVLGLTATPPTAMTRSQVQLTTELFGPILYEARIPALVKEGVLAPYAELAWLVRPTSEEDDWLRGQAERFAELTSDLFDPEFGSTTFPVWLDRRFVAPTEQTTWDALSHQEPELTDAYLRLVHAQLAHLPEDARLREPHLHPPTAQDWILLLDDWLDGCVQPGSEDGQEADTRVLEAVRRTLPAIGHVLGRHGVQAGRGIVDRVVAGSAAKQHAVVPIVAEESASLGERARVLVLCDHEKATAITRRRLRDGDQPAPDPAGSARGALATLLEDPATAALGPLLLTGRTVAGAPATLAAFREHVRATDPGLADALAVVDDRLEGPWTSGTWIRHATEFLRLGGTRCLVGTRGLLGEGWDAPVLTTLVDLTTVTTPTSVVQTRGRALRIDPDHPDKVALVWTVVCVSDQHLAGSNDWERFVRKHQGYFTIDEAGEVVDGVAGVDSRFSPYEPPPAGHFDRVNADMLVRAGRRDLVQEAWDRHPAGRDLVRHVVRVRPDRTAAALVLAGPTPPPSLAYAAQRPPRHPFVGYAAATAAALALAFLAPLLPGPAGVAGAALAAAGLLAALLALTARHGLRRIAWEADQRVTLHQLALAVADGLHRCGRSPVGPEAVRVSTRADGTVVLDLDCSDEVASALFAEAVEELAGPMAAPRHVVVRPMTLPPDPHAWLTHLLVGARGGRHADAEVWHAVPSCFRRVADRNAYAAAWRHWVGGDRVVAVATPEGAGVLATHRHEDPFAVTCVVRKVWS